MLVPHYATTEDVEKASNNSSSFSGPKIQDLLLELKPEGNQSVTKTIRLVGQPILFTQYSPFKYTADRKERTPCPFPDAEERKGFYRRGVEPWQESEYGPCPYKAAGYASQKRGAQVCLEQNEDGTWSVRILDKPKSLFDVFMNYEKGSKQRNEKRGKNVFVTCLGGTKSHLIEITASVGAGKKVEYSAQIIGAEIVEMDEDQIEALRKAGEPTEEEYAAIIAANPHLASAPKWFFYGPNLSRYFAPQLPKNGSGGDGASTSGTATAEEFNEADLADVEPKDTKASRTTAGSSTKGGKTTAEAKATPAESTSTMFADADKVVETPETPVDFETGGW